MNTDSGELRELKDGESLPSVEELEALGDAIPPEVEVPPGYLSMTPEQRLAAAFSYRPGKDRKAQGRPGVTTKAERRRRRQLRKASKRRNR